MSSIYFFLQIHGTFYFEARGYTPTQKRSVPPACAAAKVTIKRSRSLSRFIDTALTGERFRNVYTERSKIYDRRISNQVVAIRDAIWC